MREICAELGVPLASEKEVGPITRLIFLGIMLDSVAQTLSLPEGKSQEILDLLRLWSFKSEFTKFELQSLIGQLQFAFKCVPASRIFTRRLIKALSTTQGEARLPVLPSMRLDLQWWDEFLPMWNGTASFLETDWTRADTMHLYTDASATQGLGCFFN